MYLGHPAGQTGVYRPVFQGFLSFTVEKLTKTDIFVGTPASRVLLEISYDFSYVPFLLRDSSNGFLETGKFAAYASNINNYVRQK